MNSISLGNASLFSVQGALDRLDQNHAVYSKKRNISEIDGANQSGSTSVNLPPKKLKQQDIRELFQALSKSKKLSAVDALIASTTQRLSSSNDYNSVVASVALVLLSNQNTTSNFTHYFAPPVAGCLSEKSQQSKRIDSELMKNKINDFGFNQFNEVLSGDPDEKILLDYCHEINNRLQNKLESGECENIIEFLATDLQNLERLIDTLKPNVGYAYKLHADEVSNRSEGSKVVNWIRSVRLSVEIERVIDISDIFKIDCSDPLPCKLDPSETGKLVNVYNYAFYSALRPLFLKRMSDKLPRMSKLTLVNYVLKKLFDHATDPQLIAFNNNQTVHFNTVAKTDEISHFWSSMINDEQASILEACAEIAFGKNLDENFDLIHNFQNSGTRTESEQDEDTSLFNLRQDVCGPLLFLWSKFPNSVNMKKLFRNMNFAKKNNFVYWGLKNVFNVSLKVSFDVHKKIGTVLDFTKLPIAIARLVINENQVVNHFFNQALEVFLKDQQDFYKCVFNRFHAENVISYSNGDKVYCTDNKILWNNLTLKINKLRSLIAQDLKQIKDRSANMRGPGLVAFPMTTVQYLTETSDETSFSYDSFLQESDPDETSSSSGSLSEVSELDVTRVWSLFEDFGQ